MKSGYSNSNRQWPDHRGHQPGPNRAPFTGMNSNSSGSIPDLRYINTMSPRAQLHPQQYPYECVAPYTVHPPGYYPYNSQFLPNQVVQDFPPPYEHVVDQRRHSPSPSFGGQFSSNSYYSDQQPTVNAHFDNSADRSSDKQGGWVGRGRRGQGRGGRYSGKDAGDSGRDGNADFSRGHRRGRGRNLRGQRGRRGGKASRDSATNKSDTQSETKSFTDLQLHDSSSVASEDYQSNDQFDEYAAEYQQQLIKELSMKAAGEHPNAALIRFDSDEHDYDVQAFRHYIEWCSEKCGSLKELVVSTNKQYAVAVFYTVLDFDILISRMSENTFCKYSLTCESIDYCPALICFTNGGTEAVNGPIADLVSSKKILDKKSHDDYVIVSFSDMPLEDLHELVSSLRNNKNLDAFCLYPCPKDDIMYVTRESYNCFEKASNIKQGLLGRKLKQLLLLGAPDSKDLRHSMALEKFSGGHSSLQLVQAFSKSTHYVEYKFDEVAYRVFNRSPIQLKNEAKVHVVLSAGIAEIFECSDQMVTRSKYFLLLSNVPGDMCSDHLIYLIANYTDQIVRIFYFKGDSNKAMVVILFPKEIRQKDMQRLNKCLEISDEMMGVEAWFIPPILERTAPKHTTPQTEISPPFTFSQESALVVHLNENSNSVPHVPFLIGGDTEGIAQAASDTQTYPLSTFLTEESNVPLDDLLEFLTSSQMQQHMNQVMKGVCTVFDRENKCVRLDFEMAARKRLDVVALTESWFQEVRRVMSQLLKQIEKTDVPCDSSQLDLKKLPKQVLIKNENQRISLIGFKDDVRKFNENNGLSQNERSVTATKSKAKFYQRFISKNPIPGLLVKFSYGKDLSTITLKAEATARNHDPVDLDKKKQEILSFLADSVWVTDFQLEQQAFNLIKNCFGYFDKQLKENDIVVGFDFNGTESSKVLQLCAATQLETHEAHKAVMDIVTGAITVSFDKNDDYKALVKEIRRTLQTFPHTVDEKEDKIFVTTVAEAKKLLESLRQEKPQNAEPFGLNYSRRSEPDPYEEVAKGRMQPEKLRLGSPSMTSLPEQYSVLEKYPFTRDHQFIDIQYFRKKYKDQENVKVQKKHIEIKARTTKDARDLKAEIDAQWRALARVRIITKVDPQDQDSLTGRDSTLSGTLMGACKDSDAVFLLQHSKIKFFSSFGNLSMYCCNPDILTVPADSLLIAVGPQLNMNDSTVGASLASIDPQSSHNLRKLYNPSCPPEPGECIELPVCDENSLYSLYLVVVVTDQKSLRSGIINALEICLRRNCTSVVTNLIGSDMKKVMKPEESARTLFSSLTRHTEQYGEKCIQSLFICEVNGDRMETLKKEWEKYTKEIDYTRGDKACGAVSVTVCSADRNTASGVLSSAVPLIQAVLH